MKKIWYNVIFVVIVYLILCWCIRNCNNKQESNSKLPVEKSINIDSIIHDNDSLKLVVSNLDSIKDAKVIEVLTLDNDSSVRLFYKLLKGEE